MFNLRKWVSKKFRYNQNQFKEIEIRLIKIYNQLCFRLNCKRLADFQERIIR